MAFSKSNLYPEEDQLLSAFAMALGHPARLQILRQLSAEGLCCVEDIGKNHPISQPALSSHLKILRETQFVKYRERFPNIFYSLNGKTVTMAETYINDFFKGI